jgi:hypothetical protein
MEQNFCTHFTLTKVTKNGEQPHNQGAFPYAIHTFVTSCKYEDIFVGVELDIHLDPLRDIYIGIHNVGQK